MRFLQNFGDYIRNMKLDLGSNRITGTTTNKCRPPKLSELTPMIFNMGLTHLGSEASK